MIPSKPSYSHGSTGTKPSSSIDYATGDPLDADNLDYYIYTEFDKITKIIDALEGIDSDDDGKVDSADSADDATNVTSTYKGNDIDSDGNGIVNEADSANAYKGNDIDSDGDGKVDSADSADDATNVTSTYKGNDIDSNGDGKVDAADDADAISGSAASAICTDTWLQKSTNIGSGSGSFFSESLNSGVLEYVYLYANQSSVSDGNSSSSDTVVNELTITYEDNSTSTLSITTRGGSNEYQLIDITSHRNKRVDSLSGSYDTNGDTDNGSVETIIYYSERLA